MTLHAKIAMQNLQHYPWNHNLIKKCGRCRRFSDSKSVYFFEFPNCFLEARNAKENKRNKGLKEQKPAYLVHTWSDKAVFRCKVGIPIFAWRVMRNYVYKVPLSLILIRSIIKLYNSFKTMPFRYLLIIFNNKGIVSS